ncbi:MAG: ROK family protein, partial [Acidobacteriota bacterium]
NRGCWEKYASASAASSLYTGDRANFGGEIPPRFVQIVERAEAGEIRAQRTLEKLGEYLGIGIGNVIAAFGVPHVIVSGRLVYGWKYIKQPLFEAVDKSMAGKLADWTIECGKPKGSALGGALEVAVEEYITGGLII